MNNPEQVEYRSSVNIQSFLMFLFAMTVGLLVAVLLLPAWLPNMAFSLGGNSPKAYWYLSRATAFVSLSLLWLSMALGISITNKMARRLRLPFMNTSACWDWRSQSFMPSSFSATITSSSHCCSF